MSNSSPTAPKKPFEPAIPSRIDPAAEELLMAMRLKGETQSAGSADLTRRYGAADPVAKGPTSRVSR